MAGSGANLTYIKRSEKILTNIIMIGFFLMALNYLLYNFFEYDQFKDVVRVAAIGIIVSIGLIYCISRGISFNVYQMILACWSVLRLFFVRELDLNFIAIVGFALFSKVDYKKYIKVLNIYNFVFLAIVIVSLRMGWVNTHSYISTTGRIRETLGFENVNAGSLFFYSVNLVYLLSCKKIKFINFLISVIYSIVIYRLTDTRTSILGLVVFFGVLLIMKMLKNRKKTFTFILFSVITFLFISVALWDWIYVNFPELNSVLSSRVTLFRQAVKVAGFKNFWIGGMNFADYGLFVDNFFILLLFQNGMFVYAFVYLFTLYSTRKLFYSGYFKEVALILSLLCVGIVESSLIRPEVVCVMVAWRCILDTDSVIQPLDNVACSGGLDAEVCDK